MDNKIHISITEFGGKGDGCYDNTSAFSLAFSKPGIIVDIPSGVFLTGPIKISSNSGLNLSPSAILKFIDDPELYPPVYTRWEGVRCWSMHPCIYAENSENISIEGNGIIDGSGEKWWKEAREKKLHSLNGEKLRDAILLISKAYVDNGSLDANFISYVEDETKVSFPWSMIDKITPRPDSSVFETLKKEGWENMDPIITAKHTYIAPYVNAEETQYLVIEDRFPNGRPKLEESGVYFTDRETVNKTERMKVTTCLNPLHTALALSGCILSYTKINEEMKDEDLVKMIKRLGYIEGLPVVTDPKIINPKKFIDEVIDIRLPNPFMPDTPQRIATDSSQKLSIRFGETIKAYLEKNPEEIKKLRVVPLVFALFMRYLLAIDDSGRPFELSPDPMKDELREDLRGITRKAIEKAIED